MLCAGSATLRSLLLPISQREGREAVDGDSPPPQMDIRAAVGLGKQEQGVRMDPAFASYGSDPSRV